MSRVGVDLRLLKTISIKYSLVIGHIYPSEVTGLLELRSWKIARFSEHIMSVDKYSCIFSPQMEPKVYLHEVCSYLTKCLTGIFIQQLIEYYQRFED